MLDGAVAAVVAGPASMNPEEWVCPLLGVDPDAFNHDTQELSAIAATLIRHNAISNTLSTKIVCKDADIGQAAKLVAASRTLNTGQVCNAAERVYVERPIADKFVSALAESMKATRFGDPLGDKEIDMGPLINKAGLQKIEDLVESAKK